MDEFFVAKNPTDIAYIHSRDLDLDRAADFRRQVNEMWQIYKPYCPDRDFLEQAGKNFEGALWQMRLVCTFVLFGYELLKPPEDGPDICFVEDGVRFWVECVVADRGTGPDKLEENVNGGRVPENQILMRITNAITSKYSSQYEKWISKGIIKDEDRYFIAVNTWKIPFRDMHSNNHSYADKALFAIGPVQIQIEMGTGKFISSHYSIRREVEKKSKSKVDTALFHQGKMEGISGVIYSSVDALNSDYRTGKDIVFIHHPYSKHTYKNPHFKFGHTSHFDSDGKLVRTENKI